LIWTNRGISAQALVSLNQLNMTAHRLLIGEAIDIVRYLIEVRPHLKLLPNSIDIEAEDLLEAKKVNRELLLRRQLKSIQSEFDVILIDCQQ
jgi:chromosome partitioning protein